MQSCAPDWAQHNNWWAWITIPPKYTGQRLAFSLNSIVFQALPISLPGFSGKLDQLDGHQSKAEPPHTQ